MRWRTGNARRQGKEFQARLRRPLPAIRATETGWVSVVRAILTPKMRKTVHVFADHSRPFPPFLASADTRRMAETSSGSVRSTGGAVGEAETPKDQR